MTDLSLRLTVIGGETAPGDYCVIREGRSIGRIRLATERNWQGEVWLWNINIEAAIPAWCGGTASNLEAAKAEFRSAWERFYPTLTPQQITHWHEQQDHVPHWNKKP